MILEKFPELAKLSYEEKMILSSELRGEDDIELSKEQEDAIRKVLAKSWEDYEKNPDAVISYADLRKKHGLDD